MTSTVALTPHSNHVRGERLSSSATGIIPGYLVELSAGKYRPNSVATAIAPKMFALEKSSTAGDIDTAYILGETVFVGSFPAGERVAAILADTEVVTDGAYVTSGGDGTMIATGATAANAIGVSRSALTASGNTRFILELV